MASCPRRHPLDPPSNIAKVGSYDPEKYRIGTVPLTVTVNEALVPNQPPRLTQQSVALYLQPNTFELDECPPRPTIAELQDSVVNRMVTRDQAFWVDKPGDNAYTLHDAFVTYGMANEKVLPTPQAPFPRSYQFDLDCVKMRRYHACDGLKQPPGPNQKPVAVHCRDCSKTLEAPLSPFQLAWAQGSEQKRWRVYPDVSAKMSPEEIKQKMSEFGRPYHHEACSWYNENYPSIKYDVILRKFSK